MPDDSSSAAASGGGRLWRGLRALIFGDDAEPTLRDQIEEAIEEHEGEPASKGDLSAVERQMLRNLLHFGECSAGDIAVPRADIIAVPASISMGELLGVFRTAGHSRLPVYDETLDDPKGMVHIRDFLDHLAAHAEAGKRRRRRAEAQPQPAPTAVPLSAATHGLPQVSMRR